jgi:hypothetical protein
MVDHDVTGIPSFDREALVALESYTKNRHEYFQFSIGKSLYG